MGDMRDLMRAYERARYPTHRRLDVQAEGPHTVRERVLQWIQSRAHEEPGEDLLLIIARGVKPGSPPASMEVEVRKLLDRLQGRLIEWWQPFAPGSLAVRLAREPSMFHPSKQPEPEIGDGRTAETAGAARPEADRDIPPELYDIARRVTELRIEREGLSIRVFDVLLREVWNQAQVMAMEERLTFEAALNVVLDEEMKARLEED